MRESKHHLASRGQSVGHNIIDKIVQRKLFMLWKMSGRCLRRHASGRGRSAKIWSLPLHSGTGRMPIWNGSLRRLCAANAARLSRETQGEQSTCCLWAPGLMIQIKIASWPGAQSQRINRRPDQPRWQHGMRGRHGVKHILVESEGPPQPASAANP